jgi:hypothetical protein
MITVAASAVAMALVLLVSWSLGAVERQKQYIQARLEKGAHFILSRWRAGTMNA